MAGPRKATGTSATGVTTYLLDFGNPDARDWFFDIVAGQLDQATDAELLAVGTRGHGAMASRLIGSVSRYCTDNACAEPACDADAAAP